MNVWLSPAARAAMLAEGDLVSFLDTGSAKARIRYYGTARPAGGAAPGGPALLEVALAKPSGSMSGGYLRLVQDNPGDLIALDGEALWARIVNGDGDVALDGDVSDESGDGFFRVGGTEGTELRAGGRFYLGDTEIE